MTLSETGVQSVVGTVVPNTTRAVAVLKPDPRRMTRPPPAAGVDTPPPSYATLAAVGARTVPAPAGCEMGSSTPCPAPVIVAIERASCAPPLLAQVIAAKPS